MKYIKKKNYLCYVLRLGPAQWKWVANHCRSFTVDKTKSNNQNFKDVFQYFYNNINNSCDWKFSKNITYVPRLSLPKCSL
uniref:Uncharacterized protein n=1 Tax=Octopus bimaculoides TaxID=37653 RepID=A0A0L8HET1_OCTBM